MLYASAAVQIGPRRVAEKSRMGFSPFLAQLRLRDACVSGITSGHLRVFLTKTLTQGFPKASFLFSSVSYFLRDFTQSDACCYHCMWLLGISWELQAIET